MNCSDSSHGSQIIFHILWTIKVPPGWEWKVRILGGKPKWSGGEVSVIDQLHLDFHLFRLLSSIKALLMYGVEWR